MLSFLRTGGGPRLVERVAEIAKRCGDLSPLAEPVRQRLWDGNREAVLRGLTYDGRPVAPLRPATLKRRKGNGPPRAPMGAGSRVVRGYAVSVSAGPGRMTFVGGWPEFTPIIEYLDGGTRKMAARPTIGFRREDLDWVRARLREHVIPAPGGGGFFGRLFGRG